jgi:hypothetical protein
METLKESGWWPFLNEVFLMRKQYFIRPSGNGYYAWDVDKLIEASVGSPVVTLDLRDIRELDENYWYNGEGDIPTCRSIAEHFKLVMEADLDYPVILSSERLVMDGMHRIIKALVSGHTAIDAVILEKTPPPDFEDVFPEDLPYEE